MKIIRWLAIVLGACVVLALALDGMIALFQPSAGTTGVLRTFDEQGEPHERVLSLLDDGGTLWVESGHHFRGWYHRLRRNPNVELIRDGTAADRSVRVRQEITVASLGVAAPAPQGAGREHTGSIRPR